MSLSLQGIKQGAGFGLSQLKLTTDQSTLEAFAADDKDAEIIRTELGLTLGDRQTEATIEAFQDPRGAWDKFRAARDEIDKQAALMYKNVGSRALMAGVPQDEAMQYAKERTLQFHETETRLLMLNHPYVSGEALVRLASGASRRDLLGKKAAPAATNTKGKTEEPTSVGLDSS